MNTVVAEAAKASPPAASRRAVRGHRARRRRRRYDAATMDNDRLFKELLRTFFADFIDLFLPEVSAYLRRETIEFLDKEIFTDVTAGDRREVDLVVKARYRAARAFFLLHVENQ